MAKTPPSVPRKSRKKRSIPAFYSKGAIASLPMHAGAAEAAPLAQERGGALLPSGARGYAVRAADEALINSNEDWAWVERVLREYIHQGDIQNGAAGADSIIISQVTPSGGAKRKRDYSWLLMHAMQNGAKATALGSCEWNIAGSCSNPYTRTFKAPSISDAKGRITRRCAWYIDISTRCRECQACLRHRAALWRYRAVAETQHAVRTWFVTLTIRPSDLWIYKLKAIDACAKKSIHFEALSVKRQFAEVHNFVSRDITKAIKRFRKNTQIPFKYLIVAEAHKSGEPHYHMLLHERSASMPIRYDVLRSFWPHGFSQSKLVTDMQQAVYLCKYLSKSLQARVRASQRYGVNRVDDLTSIGYDVNTRVKQRPQKEASVF